MRKIGGGDGVPPQGGCCIVDFERLDQGRRWLSEAPTRIVAPKHRAVIQKDGIET
jgi:hypothetical protein